MKTSEICRSAESLIRLGKKLQECLWSDEMLRRSGQLCELTLIRPDYDAARVRKRYWLVTECDVPLRLESVRIDHCREVLAKHDQGIGIYELAGLLWNEERRAIIFRFVQSLELEFIVSDLQVIYKPEARVVGVMPTRYLLHCIESCQYSHIQF